MKSYVMKNGTEFTLVVDDGNKTQIATAMNRHDMIFDEKSLIKMDMVDKRAHFRVDDNNFYIPLASLTLLN